MGKRNYVSLSIGVSPAQLNKDTRCGLGSSGTQRVQESHAGTLSVSL